MAEGTFDRETLLDITVNVVPLGMMIFFLVLFVALSPWNASPWNSSLIIEVVSLGLLVVPIVGLALLTYIAARKI